MNLDKSKKTTKSIEELRKELSEMHKQFDNAISNTSLKNEEKTSKPITKESVELTSDSKNPSSNTEDNDSFDLLDISESSSNITSTDKNELQSKEDNDKTIHLNIKNNDTNEFSQDKVSEIKNNDRLNESYLSIKEKLEKIKNDIVKKEDEIDKKRDSLGTSVDEQIKSTTKKSDPVTKTIPKTKESGFHKNKLTLKNNDVESNKKATILTVILFMLVILVLISAYLILK